MFEYRLPEEAVTPKKREILASEYAYFLAATRQKIFRTLTSDLFQPPPLTLIDPSAYSVV